MIHFEKLVHVKDTCSYGNYTAIAQYFGNARVEIDIYLYQTLICIIGLGNRTFELANYEWTSISTLKALKEWKVYLQDNGYKLVDIEWTGSSPEQFNLDVRVPANAHIGGYVMGSNHTLQCNHVGKSDHQLKTLVTDEIYISSPTDYDLGVQPRGCYMRGRNEKEIARNVSLHDGVKFTLYFQLPEPPEIYGLWVIHDNLYLFKFRVQKVAYKSDFQALNATYTATEMYIAKSETPFNLANMIGLEDCAYNLYNDMLSEFERLA